MSLLLGAIVLSIFRNIAREEALASHSSVSHGISLDCHPKPFKVNKGDTVTVTYTVRNYAGDGPGGANHAIAYTLTDTWTGFIASDVLQEHQSDATPAPTYPSVPFVEGVDQRSHVRQFTAGQVKLDNIHFEGTFGDGHQAEGLLLCNIEHVTPTATSTPVVTATPTSTGTPSPPQRKILFIQGIGSGTNGHCDGVRNRVKTMREYLTGQMTLGAWDAGNPPLTENDFVYFDYSPGGCGEYTNEESCLSINDWADASGPHKGSSHHLDDLIRQLISDDPGVSIDIMAHSQGGLVAAYWLATFGAANDPARPGDKLYERVHSAVLFDSAPSGFPNYVAGHRVPGFACGFAGAQYDSWVDMVYNSPVTSTVRGFTPSDGTNVPRVFAIDSYPGQASPNAGPCDAVPATNMRIGSVPLVGGSPFRIWARSHGVVWDDGLGSDGIQSLLAGLASHGNKILGVHGLPGNLIDVNHTVGLSAGQDVLLHCIGRDIDKIHGNTLDIGASDFDGIQLFERGDLINKYVTVPLGSNFPDDWGLGRRSRLDLLNIVGCAVSGRSICGRLIDAPIPTNGSTTHYAAVPGGASSLTVTLTGLPEQGALTGTSSANALQVLADESVNLKLETPSGCIIDSEPACGYTFEHSSGAGFEAFDIQDPESGQWTAHIDGSKLATDQFLGLNVAIALDPSVDTDQDNVLDSEDNCPGIANLSQEDSEDDGLGDVCDDDDEGDGVVDSEDNCRESWNADQVDTDIDTQGDTCDFDDDNDGCADAQEFGESQLSGGLRNRLMFWDFFDVPTGASLLRDEAVSSLDIFGVLGRFNTTGDPGIDPLSSPPSSGYHPAYDRGAIIGPNVWNLGAADGSIAATDIFSVLGQFSHSCA